MQTKRVNPLSAFRSARLFLLGVALSVASACAGSAPDPAASVRVGLLADAPDWVVMDCVSYWGGRPGARLCGVGSVAGTRNLSLARTAAIGRARNEIAASLGPMVESMLQDYSRTTASEAGDPLTAQQISNVTTQITQFTTMNGTTLQDTWVAPDGTLYTLVDLDVGHFQSSVDQMSSLTDAIRSGVKQRAAESFLAAGSPPAAAQSTQ